MRINMVFLRLLLIGSLVFTAATALCIETLKNVSHVNYCLSSYVKPIHYNITLTIFVKSSLFYGESVISIQINRATQNISLHSANVQLYEALLINNNMKICYISKKYTNITRAHIIVLHFTHNILPGFYILKLKFKGSLANNAGIFFPADELSFISKGKNKTWFIATRFSTIGAKTVFPCWDILGLRTTFEITIRNHQNYTVRSNMPKVNSYTDENGIITTRFHTTPLMPTRLITIILMSSKDFVEFTSLGDEKFLIISKNSTKNLQFASNFGKDVLIYLKQNWAYYSVKKLEFVAIPTMNNSYSYDQTSSLGLAIFREDDIIYNRSLDSFAQKVKVMRVVSREMAYQWVGHLVNYSPHFTHLWLQIGFIIFFGAHATSQVAEHKSRMIDLFIVQTQQESLHLDDGYLMSSLMFEVNDPSEITSQVSFAHHLKAPIVFRMMRSIVPFDVFQRGIIKYLDQIQLTTCNTLASISLSISPFRKNLLQFSHGFICALQYLKHLYRTSNHGFGLATPDYLWVAMQSFLNMSSISWRLDVKDIMHTLIMHNQYFVIGIRRIHGLNLVRISIENLQYTHYSKHDNWAIFITITTQENPTFSINLLGNATYWLSPKLQLEVEFIIPADRWYIANLQQTGYYRVNYDANNWQQIANYLNSEHYLKIHVLNRAQIIDDAFHFMIARKFESSLFWEITNYLSQEMEYVAWYPMFKALEYMSTAFHYEAAKSIKERISNILGRLFDTSIGYNEKTHDDDFIKYLRLEARKWACILENMNCRKNATATLAAHFENPTKKISGEWDDWLYCKGLMIANYSIWHKIEEIFRPKISSYLACSKNSNIIIRHLNDLITTLRYNYDAFFYVVARHAQNDMVLTYILQQYVTLKRRDVSTIVLMSVIINHVYSYENIEKLYNFVEKARIAEQELPPILSKLTIRRFQLDKQIEYINLLKYSELMSDEPYE